MNSSWQDRVLRQFLDDRADAPDETSGAAGAVGGYLVPDALARRLTLGGGLLPRRRQPATPRVAAPSAQPSPVAAGEEFQ